MDARRSGGDRLGDRLPGSSQKPRLSPATPPLQLENLTTKVLAGLAFSEMLSQYPRSAFQGLCGDGQRVCDPNPRRPFARYRSFRCEYVRRMRLHSGEHRKVLLVKLFMFSTLLHARLRERVFRASGPKSEKK